MKTLLSTAALTALLVSGAALADGVSMKNDRASGHGMSEMRSHMQTGDARHMGRNMYAGEGHEYSSERHERDDDDREESYRGYDRHDRDYDDDEHRRPHMKNIDRDRS